MSMLTKNWVPPLFFSLFLLVGAAMLLAALWEIYMSARVARWPTTVGTIREAAVERQADSDGDTYKVKVRYGYTVEGQEYEGDRLAYGHSPMTGEGSVQTMVARLRAGRNVMVRYDPASPGRSALTYGLGRTTRFKLIFGVVWLGFTLGMMAMVGLNNSPDQELLEHLVVR